MSAANDNDGCSTKFLRLQSPTSRKPPPSYDLVLSIVLENVLQFLTCRRDRNAASLVCKKWCEIEAINRGEVFIGNCYSIDPTRAATRFPNAKSLILKGKPSFVDYYPLPPDWGAKVIPWIFSFGKLEKIFLKRMSVSDYDLALIAECFSALKGISFVCCEGFSTAGVAVLVETCRQLRVLDLLEGDMRGTEEEVVDWIVKFPQNVTCLESLVFEYLNCPVNFESLESLVARSPRLKQLRLSHNVSALQLKRLMKIAPQLTHLGTGSLKAIDVGNDIAPQIAEHELENLTSSFAASKNIVSLSGFYDLSPKLLPAILPVCANLVSLNISFVVIGPEQFKKVIFRCHKLQRLQVNGSVLDEGLQMVAATCKDLHELVVFNVEEEEGFVSDVGLTAIAEGCSKLCFISYFCQKISNAAMVSLSKNCQDLVDFRLYTTVHHDHITGESMDTGFGSIVASCKKLTRLAMTGLVTDKAFAYIGKFGNLLRTLYIGYAGNSDLSLKYVLEGCKNLQKLEIRNCPWGDSGLLSGLHHYNNMRFLWMVSCRVSLSGCEEVEERLPNIVVEVIRDQAENNDNEVVDIDSDNGVVDKLYLYRSLMGARNDAPSYVEIL